MKRKQIVRIAGFSMMPAAILLAGCALFPAKPEPESAAEVTESGNAAAKSEPESAAEVTESGNAAAKSEPEPAAKVTESGNAAKKSEPEPASREVTESRNAAALECGNTLLKAFQENRYDLLKEALAENLQKDFSPEAFSQTLAQLQRTLGTLRSFEYLCELKTPLLKTLIWKLRFSRKASEGGGDIEQETLFKVLIAPVDGKSQVISFNFL